MNLVKKALLLIVVLGICVGGFLYKKSSERGREAQVAQAHMEFDYTYDKREVFNDDASSDLAELDKNIKQLEDKAAASSETVKTDAVTKIQNLTAERATLGKKLEALKDAKESNWNSLKVDFQKSEDQMKASLKDTWQWLAGKTPT